jgi:hypothetical protein
MEDKGWPLKQLALQGTLEALSLDALRLYLLLMVGAEEIGRESASACRRFDVRWERVFRAKVVSGPWDARVTSPILAPASQGGERAWRLSSSSIGNEKVDPRRAYHSWAGNRSIDRISSLAFLGGGMISSS